jgi:hypothetical protein
MRNTAINALQAVNTSSQNGPAIDGSQVVAASFQFTFGDATAAGTCTVQVSNDIPPAGQGIQPGLGGPGANSFTPTNWSNYAAGTAITAGASALVNVPQAMYKWFRVQYTRTSGGSSTVTCNMTGTYL